jgi:hypothetical protein
MEGEYIDNKLQGKVPQNSNYFCVQIYLSGRTWPINIMLIGHDMSDIGRICLTYRICQGPEP